ncbi:hypothetical protein CVT24_002502, partial [Panaeolus cyanescens]
MSKHDPYARYKGQFVIVTGQHHFKGQRGRICDTHYDGRLWVQMESVLNGSPMLQFKHYNISLIEPDTNLIRPLSDSHLPISHSSLFPLSITNSQESIPRTDTNPLSNVPSTPMANSLPVVDDSIDFPETDNIVAMPIEDPYWLIDTCFPQRIKLSHMHDPHHIIQLVGRGSQPGMVQ